MIPQAKQFLFLSPSTTTDTTNDLKISCLRIMTASSLLIAIMILVWRVSEFLADGNPYQILLILPFIALLVLILSGSRHSRTLSSAVLIAIMYAAGFCIAVLTRDRMLSQIGLIFLFIIPLVARVLFDVKQTIAFMILNIIPFVLLQNGYHFYQLSPNRLLSQENAHVYIYSVLFVFINILLPLTVSRILHTLRSYNSNISSLNRDLLYNQNLYRSVFENTATASVICNQNGMILKVNKGIEDLTGYTRMDLEEKQDIDFIIAAETKKSCEDYRLCYTGNLEFDSSVFEFNVMRKDGKTKFVLARFGILIDSGLYIVSLFDFTKTRETETELKKSRLREEYHKNHDSMTGLPTRDFFRNMTELELQKTCCTNSRAAVICIGLDRFKYINDTFGTDVGDSIIKEFALRLKELLRNSDLVGRLNGDIFVCLINDITHHEEFIALLTKKINQFLRLFNYNDSIIEISASVGISFFPDDSKNADTLLRHSEIALDIAKRKRQGGITIFNNEIGKIMAERFRIESDLKKAVRERELSLHYQPKVDYTGNVVGFEALIRWNTSDGSLISPGLFIPAAEELGIIYMIDMFIIEAVCQNISQWKKKYGSVLPVSVNLSAKNLAVEAVLDCIINTVHKYNIKPSQIEIEITETGIMENERSAIKLLNSLIQEGFRISIDDFGIGYSSLNKLKDFPVNTLKIDKSFVDEIPGNEKAENIVRTIVTLARNLNFSLVAEGVERQEQADFLNRLGCGTFQGYLYYKPMPQDELAALLSSKGGNTNG
ncbi:MAG: EAL domain-containing protein [Spirochaetota bacterium]